MTFFLAPTAPFCHTGLLTDYSETKDAFYKSAKLDTNGDVKGKGKAVAVVDEPEDGSDFAGPELPPDFEEDVPDDEEGRFFGGGMAKETAQAMDYLDRQDQAGDTAVSLEL